MKNLSLKVMTLLMAALVLSASGCFNDEMSSPEGTVKGYYKALNQYNYKKMLDYFDPSKGYKKINRKDVAATARYIRKSGIVITDVKTTLVSKKESLVWKGDKWGNRKWATVEVSYKIPDLAHEQKGENRQDTWELVMLDNKWYIISE